MSRGNSIYSMAVELIQGSDQDWSATEVLTALRQLEKPIASKNPMNAVRTALARAVTEGVIQRSGEGRYAALGWMSDAQKTEENLGERYKGTNDLF